MKEANMHEWTVQNALRNVGPRSWQSIPRHVRHRGQPLSAYPSVPDCLAAHVKLEETMKSAGYFFLFYRII